MVYWSEKDSVRVSTRWRSAVLWPRVAKGAAFYRDADNARPRLGSVAPGGARLGGRGPSGNQLHNTSPSVAKKPPRPPASVPQKPSCRHGSSVPGPALPSAPRPRGTALLRVLRCSRVPVLPCPSVAQHNTAQHGLPCLPQAEHSSVLPRPPRLLGGHRGLPAYPEDPGQRTLLAMGGLRGGHAQGAGSGEGLADAGLVQAASGMTSGVWLVAITSTSRVLVASAS